MPTPPTHLLYLHGFRSSPLSFKAHRLHDWLRVHQPALTWWCPQLPPSPAAAWALIEHGIEPWPQQSSVVVGSSLGGFYATTVAERNGWRAVVLNPAVNPARDLERHIGEQSHFHNPNEHFEFRREYIAELQALAASQITNPQRYAAVIAKGDEVLDWREMAGRYPGATIRLLEGGDHALSDFDDHLPFLLQFLHLQS